MNYRDLTARVHLTMNDKFQYRTSFDECGIENFGFIVSERVQVNPDNLRAMSALTFLLFKLNTLHKAGKTVDNTQRQLNYLTPYFSTTKKKI